MQDNSRVRVFIKGMVFIEGIKNMVFIEGRHRRQVIVSNHGTNVMHNVESQNMDGIEDGTHDVIISITHNSCMNLIKY